MTPTERNVSEPMSEETASQGGLPGESLLELRNLQVRFRLHGGFFGRQSVDFFAVDQVSFTVLKGKTLGLVGETGSGKSTIAQAIMGMIEPHSGSIVIAGEESREGMAQARRRLMQMVMQDPYSSLDPRMKVEGIVSEPLTLGRRSRGRGAKTRVKERVSALQEFVGLRASNADRFPNEFSGGQRQRIAIARALASSPQLIVLDEPTSALDTSVKAQILNLLRRLQEEEGLTYLMISHDLATVAYLSSEVAVMYRGRVVEIGPTSVFQAPRHPYTLELLGSVPGAQQSGMLKQDTPGQLQAESLPPEACRFARRCLLRDRLGNPSRCSEEDPELRVLDGHHKVACHFAELGEPEQQGLPRDDDGE